SVVGIEPLELGLELLEQRGRQGIHGRVVDRDDCDCPVVLDRDKLAHAYAVSAGWAANCSRNAVLRNLPTAVFGISSTNSKRSGSHHFAKLGARNSRSSSSDADGPLLRSTRG